MSRKDADNKEEKLKEERDRIQLIVIEGETEEIRTFWLSKKKLKALITMVVATFFTLSFFTLRWFVLREKAKKLSQELASINAQNKHLKAQVAELEKDRKQTLSKLKAKLTIIDKIFKTIGVSAPKGSYVGGGEGGVSIPIENMTEDELAEVLPDISRLIGELKTTPLSYPTYGRFTSKFGLRRDPFTGQLEFHPGIDIANRIGTPVRVTADGVVVRAGWWEGWGRCIVVNHGNGFETLYAHLRKIYVKVGERVKRGQVIGLMGDSGRSTGPHLHYGIIYRGRWINPIRFLEVSSYVRKERS